MGGRQNVGLQSPTCNYSAQPHEPNFERACCIHSHLRGFSIDDGKCDSTDTGRQLSRGGDSGSFPSPRHSADAVIESDEAKGVLGLLNASRKKAGPCLVC